MTNPLILSFGSINIDVTARTRRLPRPGETVHGESYAIGLGGKGANQAAAAARLGAGVGVSAALVGRIGCDAFGARAREALGAFGVELEAMREDAAHPTGLALIGIEESGENCITVVGGANMAVGPADVAGAEAVFARAAVVLLQLEVPLAAVSAAAERGRAAGAQVVLDPAPAPSGPLPASLWALVDVVTPNESETEALTGIRPEGPEDAARAARALLALGARAAAVKMGGRGVWWQQGEAGGFVPPLPVRVVDTVAAGDCFNAGLAVGLAAGRDLAEAVRMAAVCGALAVTRPGAAEAAPDWEAVRALLG